LGYTSITFESENLVVDYISFNIQGLVGRKQVERIAKYFFQILGFNSTFAKGSTGKEEDLFFDFRNQHQVSFRYYLYASEYTTYWSGTKVDFSGKNATQFYTLIKQQKFDWNIFDLSSTSLGRFDYYYFRPITDAHNDDKLKYFMQSSCDKILTNYKRRKATFGREETGYVTRIGSRTSSNYYRIYQTEQGLKFELELKNPLVKSFQSFLFNNQIEIFERKLALHFYKLSINQTELNSPYTDWLVSWLRQIIQKPDQNILETTYLENHRLLSFAERGRITIYGVREAETMLQSEFEGFHEPNSITRPTNEEYQENNVFDGRFRKGMLSGESNTLNEQYTEADAKLLVSDKTLQDQANERRRLGQKNPNKMSMYEQGKAMGYSIVGQKYKHCNPNKPELPSSPDNVKHIVNALELIPSETEIAKAGVLDGARIAWSEKLNVPESSISDQTALQGIIFLNEDCTIERVN